MGWWKERKYPNGRDLLTNISHFTMKRHQVDWVNGQFYSVCMLNFPTAWAAVFQIWREKCHWCQDYSVLCAPVIGCSRNLNFYLHKTTNQGPCMHGSLNQKRHFPLESHTTFTLGRNMLSVISNYAWFTKKPLQTFWVLLLVIRATT